MPSIFQTIARNFQSGLQEVREGLPLARSQVSPLLESFGEAIQVRHQEPKEVSPAFLEKPLFEQLTSPEVAAEAQRRTGNVFSAVASVLKAPEDEKVAREQGLIPLPGTSLSFDVFGAVGSIKRVGGKQIPKALESLAEEARKFKTVNEFTVSLKNRMESLKKLREGSPGDERIVNAIKTVETKIKQATPEFFKKAKESKPLKASVISEPEPLDLRKTKKPPVPEQRIVHPTQATEVSNASKIDAELGRVFRREPASTPDFIAMRTTPSGKQIPAIREQSGVFAQKQFETYNFTDIRGLISGPRGISFNFRDAAFSFDNLTARQASQRGGWGPMVEAWYKHEEAIANRFSFLGSKSAVVRNLAEKNAVKVNDQTGRQLFDALEGKTKGIPQNIVKLADGLRDQVLNTTRETANNIRKQLGKPEIGFLKNYAPHMQDVSFWRRMLTDAKTTITDNFDFIIPNAKRNPHALRRKGGMQDLETNAWKLIDSYLDNLSNDIYISPQIEQLKAIGSVLRGREQFGMARFLDDYVRQNLVGKPGQVDSLFGIVEGSKVRAGLGRVNMARNISALAFNIVWTVFVQPASLVLTAARGGGATRGIQNTIIGMTKFAFQNARNQRVRNLPTLVVKTEGASVGMTGAGDLDRMATKIFQGRIQSPHEWNPRTNSKELSPSYLFRILVVKIRTGHEHDSLIQSLLFL